MRISKLKIYYTALFAFLMGFLISGIVEQQISPVKIQIHIDRESKQKGNKKVEKNSDPVMDIPETKAPQKII